MSDRYVVIGNPIHHSRSPAIHTRFAKQTGQDITYDTLIAPLDAFPATVLAFRDAGGRGANVTVPFKEQAWQLADRRSPRAELAGAANTLYFDGSLIYADNTDGIGLVNDILHNIQFTLSGKRILLIGAGGAAKGVLAPLLAQSPQQLCITNRTPDKAVALANLLLAATPGRSNISITGMALHALGSLEFDCVINATSASLNGESLPLPTGLFAANSLAYDMMYAAQPTAFMQYASQQGAHQVHDGLGMLVEQAAESFALWRGIRPDTRPVLAELRASLTSANT